MLSFAQYLNEALSDIQRLYVKDVMYPMGRPSPETRSTEYSDSLFGMDPNSIRGPFKDGTVLDNGNTVVFDMPKEGLKFDAPTWLKGHLDYMGYDVHDYKNGLAIRKGGTRPIKIGKLFSKELEPPKDLDNMSVDEINEYQSRKKNHTGFGKWYNSDDMRVLANTDLQILISRDPYKVAEMSTNKQRINSCMNLGICPQRDIEGKSNLVIDGRFVDLNKEFNINPDDPRRTGQNAHYVESALHAGAHIAYLIAAGDHDLKNPFARVLLEPFHSNISSSLSSINKLNKYRGVFDQLQVQNDTILRVSPKIYSSPTIRYSDVINRFKDIINGELIRRMPGKRGTVYHIDPLLYKDHDITHHFGLGYVDHK